MTLRLLINLVRWSWGLPSFCFSENLETADLAFLMGWGAVLDIFAIVGLVVAIKSFVENRRNKK